MSAPGWTSRLFSKRVNFVKMSPGEWRVYTTLNRLNWALVAVILLVVFLTVWLSRLKFSAAHLPLSVVEIVAFGLLSLFYTYVRRDSFVLILSNTIALTAAIRQAAVLLSYATQFWGASLPLRDGALARLDSALGVDWPAWFVWLNGHPLLALVLRSAYVSAALQMLMIVWFVQFALSWEIRLQRMMLASQLAAIATFAVAALVPALGAYHYFEPVLNINDLRFSPAVTDGHVAAILNLRGPTPVLPLDLEGVITFPSYHTVLAIMLGSFFWRNRILRWPALAVNGLMILATPLFGAHYAVDVMAGSCVAIAAIGVASSISRYIENSQRSPTAPLPEFAEPGLTQPALAEPVRSV